MTTPAITMPIDEMIKQKVINITTKLMILNSKEETEENKLEKLKLEFALAEFTPIYQAILDKEIRAEEMRTRQEANFDNVVGTIENLTAAVMRRQQQQPNTDIENKNPCPQQ